MGAGGAARPSGRDGRRREVEWVRWASLRGGVGVAARGAHALTSERPEPRQHDVTAVALPAPVILVPQYLTNRPPLPTGRNSLLAYLLLRLPAQCRRSRSLFLCFLQLLLLTALFTRLSSFAFDVYLSGFLSASISIPSSFGKHVPSIISGLPSHAHIRVQAQGRGICVYE